ncbi:aminoglycoside phosphotransferase [Hirsutella rhossiliensis]|uniref:Aminoglycoside phosphotransferase n=1 Tax=Hirsutella rhossiliensis TaxID=111463 RepID=A0A9P8SHZ6_9HYPO|nr:Aminoglycoside phosphotransferase [Hirsutella rhossiliensis]KAH0963331.1 Aminoglycoside phosphotransferase [Hirsutella rhossiliensis]
MLSETWEESRHDSGRRANLFRHLSRIMLNLAKLPLPRIGSWTIDDGGVLKLANRPLTLLFHQLENAGIATEIPRDRTYTSVEPYLLDLITCHDNRVRHQPNSIHHQSDGEQQLAALTAMRALLPKFMDPQLREGPFIFSLTDLHQSNIFVDDDWHITSIIDLEWACSRPIEMVGPPDWLSDRSLEEIFLYFDDYAALHDEFVDAVESEGLELYHTNFSAKVMRACWKTGSFWYSRALDSPTTLPALYIDHIQPRFVKLSTAAWAEFSHMLMALWDLDSRPFISFKVREQEQYDNKLRNIFAQSQGEENASETG